MLTGKSVACPGISPRRPATRRPFLCRGRLRPQAREDSCAQQPAGHHAAAGAREKPLPPAEDSLVRGLRRPENWHEQMQDVIDC